jgi:hypothetical protein
METYILGMFWGRIPNNFNPVPANNTDQNTVMKYASSINASILSAHLAVEDLLDVTNMYKIKSLSNEQLARVDITLKNIISALYDVKNALNF